MATLLNVRTDIAAAQRGLKQLSRDLEGIGTTATAMGRDSDRAVDQLSESLDTAEKQAIEAAEAVQSIGDKEAVAALDSIKEAAKDLASQHSNTATASGAAKKATQELEAQNRRAGEATKQLTETLYDLTRGLGAGGVTGGVQAALPKLTGLVNLLGGPWGAALTVSAGLLATLITGLMDSAEAEKEAEAATKRHLEAMEAYIQKLKERLEWEQKLKGADSQSATQTVEDLKDQIAIQEQMTDQIVKDREERESRLETLKKEIQEAQKDLPVPGKGLITIHDKETRALIARLKKEQQELEAANAESHRQQVERFQEIAGLRTKLSAAQQVAERKRREEEKRAHQERLKELEEQKRKQEEKKPADRKRLSDLENEITVEIDPEKASRDQVELNRTERLKQAEELRKTLNMSWEDYGRLVTRINQAYMSELQKLMELQTRKQAEAAEKAAVPQQAGPQNPAAQPARQAAAAGSAIDTAARKIADDIEKQVADARESGEIPRATRQELNQAAEALANRRKTAEFQQQRQELEARQKAEAERRAVQIAEEDPRTAEIQSEKLRQQQERERTRLADQQKRARQAEEARARRELVQGTVNPKELQAAQESHIKSTLDAAQANGQLNQQVVQALHKTTDLLLQSQQETADLQAKVRHLDKFIQQASSNQRRRAQMGGGR